MLEEIDHKEIKKAVGKKVEIIAYGIPYIGTLERFDKKNSRLVVRDNSDVAMLDLDRIESFKLVD